MTISSSIRTAGPFVGNGITKDFPFSYKVFTRQDVLVAQTLTATGVETIKVLDADYSVSLNADQDSNPGGVISMRVAPPIGTTLAATSNISLVQALDLTNQGGFYPRVINDALDRLVINVQQLHAKIGGGLNIGSAATITAITDFIANAGSSAGSSLLGFIQAGAGATLRTVEKELRDTSFTPLQFGAIGNGTVDDSAAILKAIAALPLGAWLDGKGRTYRVSGLLNVNSTVFRMRNFKLVGGSDYATQAAFVITSLLTELEDITVDFGRGTYKTGVEPWTKFTTFAGYDSIEPTTQEVFKITSWSEAAVVKIRDVDFSNVHAKGCIEVNTYGTVFLDGHTYSNISNKTYHVYHSPDDGVTQAGRTIVGTVSARDIGLLPDNFTVDSVAKTFASTTAVPQGSFNFIVSHGDYLIGEAYVRNYASTGVCGDRNKVFIAGTIDIRNDSARSLSNNPSGAMWLENCGASNISDLLIDIQDRDPRDTALDSSALQLFCKDSQTNIVNLIIRGNDTTAKLRKGIRGSMSGKAIVTIQAPHVSGLYTLRPVDFGVLPNSVIGHEIRFKAGRVFGDINIDQPKLFELDGVKGTGAVTISASGNPGITGTVEDVVLSRSVFTSFTNLVPITRLLQITKNPSAGLLTCGQISGALQIEGNPVVAGITASGSSAAMNITNNGKILDTTVIGSANTLNFAGNTTSRRVEIKDVQTFTVSGNTIRTDQAEPAMWVNPNNPALVLAGIIHGNNVLIKTGTTGAGSVNIAGTVTGVIEGTNNKLTVNWT